MAIHFGYDEKCRTNAHKHVEATQLAKGDNEHRTLTGCLAGYSFI